MNITKFLPTVTIALSAACSAHAVLYVSESFDYAPGSVAGNSGGTGFGGTSWAFDSSGTASEVLTTGLTFSGLASSGGAASISAVGSNSDQGRLQRQWSNATPTNSDLWVSYLINQTSAVAINSFNNQASSFGSEFVTDGTGNRKYFTDAKYSFGFNDPYAIRGGVGNNSDATGPFDLVTGTSYFVLTKFGNINYGNFTTNTTTIDVYIYNEADFATLTSAGLNEGNLASTATAMASGSIVDPDFGTPGVNVADLVRFRAANGSAVFDELSVGSTFSDVVAVPEPNSAVLIGLGALGLAALRRYRR